MHAVVPLLALTALGIDVGWEPAPAGGWDYIIQVEPEALDALSRGVEIASDLPPEIRDVRSLRLRIGNRPVPRTAAKPIPGGDEDGPRLISAVEVEPPRTKPRSTTRAPATQPQRDSLQRESNQRERSAVPADRSDSLTVDPPQLGPQMPASSWQSSRQRQEERTTNGAVAAPRWDDAMAEPSSRTTTNAQRESADRRSSLLSDPPTTVEFGPVDEEREPSARTTTTPPAGRAARPTLDQPARSLNEPRSQPLPQTDYAARDERPWRDEDAFAEDSRSRSRLDLPAEEAPAQDSPRIARSTIGRRADETPVEHDLGPASQYAYPLTVALVGLFLSMGGNLFLGWMTLDLRNRCRRLLVRLATGAPLRGGSLGGGELEF